MAAASEGRLRNFPTGCTREQRYAHRGRTSQTQAQNSHPAPEFSADSGPREKTVVNFFGFFPFCMQTEPLAIDGCDRGCVKPEFQPDKLEVADT